MTRPCDHMIDMSETPVALPPPGRLRVGATRSGLPEPSTYAAALVLASTAMAIAASTVTHGLSPVVASLLLAVLSGLSATATT